MIELLTGLYGVGMSLSPLLQARRMRRRGSSQDVSMAYLAILLGGFVLYLTYGLSIQNRVLVVTNIVSVVVTSATLALAWRLRLAPVATAPTEAPDGERDGARATTT